MKLRNIILIITIITCNFSCKVKEFHPDENDYRDELLIGTWKSINSQPKDSVFHIFTNDGYYRYVHYINNEQLSGFENLGDIWYTNKSRDQVFHESIYEHWTARRYKSSENYKFSTFNDTLFLGYDEPYIADTLVLNDYQLIYEGKYYQGIDTTRYR